MQGFQFGILLLCSVFGTGLSTLLLKLEGTRTLRFRPFVLTEISPGQNTNRRAYLSHVKHIGICYNMQNHSVKPYNQNLQRGADLCIL